MIDVDIHVLKELITIHRRVGVLLKGLDGTLQRDRENTTDTPKQKEGKGSNSSSLWLRDKKPDAQQK